jgi:hypothetical protein
VAIHKKEDSIIVITKKGSSEIIAIEYIGIKDCFDFNINSETNTYYSNDIVSLQSIDGSCIETVLFVTLQFNTYRSCKDWYDIAYNENFYSNLEWISSWPIGLKVEALELMCPALLNGSFLGRNVIMYDKIKILI